MDEDVFSRLYKDSTSGARFRQSIRSCQQKRNDSTNWDLKLAAECRLVDNQPSFKRANRPIQFNSLSTQNLSTLVKTKNSTPPSKKRLNQSQLRPISVIMSPDGTVERTEWYYITDSVEPPPFNGQKPNKAKLISPHQGIFPSARRDRDLPPDDNGIVPEDELEKVRRSIRKLQRKKIIWANSAESACDHKIPQSLKVKEIKKEKQIEIVDPVTPLNIEKKPEAMPVVSYACRSWEHCGYPNSLSFLLDK